MVAPSQLVLQAFHTQLAHVATRYAHDFAVSASQWLARDAWGLSAQCLACQRVDGRKSSAAGLAACIVELLEPGRAENIFNRVETLCRKTKTVSLRSEDDGRIALEDEKGDLGTVEGASEEEGSKAGAGNEDRLWRAHGGRWGDSEEEEGYWKRGIMARICMMLRKARCMASSVL